MIGLNYVTDWYAYIKSAFEKDKTSYSVLKFLFFMLNCSMIYFFYLIIEYDFMPTFIIIISAMLFLTSYILECLSCVKIVHRIRIRLQSKYFSKMNEGVK